MFHFSSFTVRTKLINVLVNLLSLSFLFQGHRITAMSELPISGEDSLIYGSGNAGGECDVKNSDPDFTKRIYDASIALGLKPHHVINGKSTGGELEIASCVDLEGHLGKDNRRYLLDFSRTFPPVFRAQETRQPYDTFWPFYHMFRAEFMTRLKQYGFGCLSADAYSSFQSPAYPEEKSANHQAVREASETLINVSYSVAEYLDSLCDKGDAISSLSQIFHGYGLNMRYLGLVYQRCVGERYRSTRSSLYKKLLVEGLVRTFKNHLRSRMRKQDGESHLLREIRDVLNSLFCRVSDRNAWTQRNPFVLESLRYSFNFDEKDAGFAVTTFSSKSVVDIEIGDGVVKQVPVRYVVLQKLAESCGIEVDEEVMKDLASDLGVMRGRSFESETIFEDQDFKFVERVKQLDIVQRAFGLTQYLRGYRELNTNPLLAEQFLLRGFFLVEKTLETSPLDPWLTALLGDISAALWEINNTEILHREAILKTNAVSRENMGLTELKTVTDVFKDRAKAYYKLSLSALPVASVMRNYASFLMKTAQFAEAEKYLVEALRMFQLEHSKQDSGDPDDGGSLRGFFDMFFELETLRKECTEAALTATSAPSPSAPTSARGGSSVLPTLATGRASLTDVNSASSPTASRLTQSTAVAPIPLKAQPAPVSATVPGANAAKKASIFNKFSTRRKDPATPSRPSVVPDAPPAGKTPTPVAMTSSSSSSPLRSSHSGALSTSGSNQEVFDADRLKIIETSLERHKMLIARLRV